MTSCRIIKKSPAVQGPLAGASVTSFNNISFNDSGVYGVSQLGSRADPLQGVPVPEGFVPTDGLEDQGFSITAEDVVDTVLDFIPLVGGAKDIYKGIRDGDGWQVAIGAGSIALDVVTFGSAAILKGAVKTGIKAGVRAIAKGGQTIVGEGMKRLSSAAAKNPGSIILNNMPKFSGSRHQVTSKMMQYNRQWLLHQMRSGRPIMDIGLDPTRGAPSIFYQMEQRMISNYLKLHPNAFKVIKP